MTMRKFELLNEKETLEFIRLGLKSQVKSTYNDFDFMSMFRINNVLECTQDEYTTCGSCRMKAVERIRESYKIYTKTRNNDESNNN